MSPEEIELYRDLIKIGIPALVGLLSGSIIGLIPYFLEKQKIKNSNSREDIQFRRLQTVSLIDSLSEFSGNLNRYISLKITRGRDDDGYKRMLAEASNELLASEFKLNRAIAIAGMLGCDSLVEKLTEYDIQASKTINSVNNTGQTDTIDSLKQLHSELIGSLSELLDG